MVPYHAYIVQNPVFTIVAASKVNERVHIIVIRRLYYNGSSTASVN
jgi:hypothetical protein